MKKKLISILLCAVTAATLVLGCSTSESSSTSKSDADKPKDKGANPEDYQVVMIVKQSDSWFDDMATGIDQLKKDTGLNWRCSKSDINYGGFDCTRSGCNLCSTK